MKHAEEPSSDLQTIIEKEAEEAAYQFKQKPTSKEKRDKIRKEMTKQIKHSQKIKGGETTALSVQTEHTHACNFSLLQHILLFTQLTHSCTEYSHSTKYTHNMMVIIAGPDTFPILNQLLSLSTLVMGNDGHTTMHSKTWWQLLLIILMLSNLCSKFPPLHF